MGKLLFILLPLFFSTNVWATFTVAITGVSGTYTVGTAVTAFGAMSTNANNGVTCNQDGVDPCNNCAAQNTFGCTPSALLDTANTATNQSPLCSCQGASIYNNLQVIINLTKATGTTNPSALAYISFGTLTSGTGSTNYSNISQSGAVQVPWGIICQNMTANTTGGTTASSDCSQITSGSSTIMTVWTDNAAAGGVYQSTDDQVQITFKIVNPGLNENVYGTAATDGLGQFSAFPGDSRIYLTDLDTSSGNNFPNMNDTAQAASLNVYMSPVGLDNANPSDPSVIVQSVGVNTDGSLAQNYVGGVTNGIRYWVRIATVDQANNIMQFYPDILANLPSALNAACSTSPYTGCPYTVVPEQVLGLLTNDFNCFIASAAYGSSLEPKLKVFRDFRFNVLLRHPFGIKMVYAYYKYGPYAARFISDKPMLRAIARGFLWPLYGFCWSTNHYGLVKSLLLSLILLATLLGLPWFGVRRWRARA